MGSAALTPRQIPAFSGLASGTLELLEQRLVMRRFSDGATIQLEGDECRGVYWVAWGQVRIFRTALDGRELLLEILEKGEPFNLVPPFDPQPRTRASARAFGGCQLWFLSNAHFLELLHRCPDLSLVILRQFATQLGQLHQLAGRLALLSVRGRLARFLLDQADGVLPPQRHTQEEIAQRLGTVRDVVGRTLRTFEEERLILRARGEILLLDRHGLEKAANE